MNTSGKKILITGGGSGIGLAMAGLFVRKGNEVLIVGRNEERLKKAAREGFATAVFAADISKESGVSALKEYVGSAFGGLDILINNAAVTNVYNLKTDGGMFEKAAGEIAANYLAVVDLIEKLFPFLEKQPEAAIVNVNAIIGLSPSVYMPTHSASKAALRAFSQILRYTLEKSKSTVKVFEIYPPLVKTNFSAAIGSAQTGIPPEEVAEALVRGLEENTGDIYIGAAEKFYQGFFAGTAPALDFLNQPRN